MANRSLKQSRPGILVVDDQPLILTLLRTVFRRRGFRVYTTDSGQRALQLYQQQGEKVDVVLLDVCMPILDGPTTLEHLQQLNPAIRACFMSGSSGCLSAKQIAAWGALRLYTKPFQIGPLAEDLWQIALYEHASVHEFETRCVAYGYGESAYAV